jgi:hypothetical protein
MQFAQSNLSVISLHKLNCLSARLTVRPKAKTIRPTRPVRCILTFLNPLGIHSLLQFVHCHGSQNTLWTTICPWISLFSINGLRPTNAFLKFRIERLIRIFEIEQVCPFRLPTNRKKPTFLLSSLLWLVLVVSDDQILGPSHIGLRLPLAGKRWFFSWC